MVQNSLINNSMIVNGSISANTITQTNLSGWFGEYYYCPNDEPMRKLVGNCQIPRKIGTTVIRTIDSARPFGRVSVLGYIEPIPCKDLESKDFKYFLYLQGKSWE